MNAYFLLITFLSLNIATFTEANANDNANSTSDVVVTTKLQDSDSEIICHTNRNLIAMGFVEHPTSEFDKLAQDLYLKVIYDSIDFKLDLKNTETVPEIGRNIELESWDDQRTDTLEMYGDVIFIRDPNAKQLIEIRWYENGVKHFSVNTNIKHPIEGVPTCAMPYYPFVTNALF